MAAAIRLSQQHSCSFDYLVGGRKQRRWNGETKRSGSRNVDDEIELGRLHHWKVGWFGALENAGGIEPRHPKRLRQAGAVAHQASSLGGLTLVKTAGRPWRAASVANCTRLRKKY